MDLGTISKKLDNCRYHDIGDFQRDVNLTFDNAMEYTEEGTIVNRMAKELKDKFEEDYQKLAEREICQNDSACRLCGSEPLFFEPPFVFCNGLNSCGKHIKRNEYYYIGGNILYAKPDDQKTRRDSRLQQWFSDMLVEGQRRNVVGKVTNVYDLYFAKESLDATAVPYLEGDYFPGGAERIIKGELENGVKTTGNEVAGSVKKLKNDMETQGDRVMVKLPVGKMIKPMKENCFVAFLNLAEATEKKKEVPDGVMKYRSEHPEAMIPLAVGRKRDAEGNTFGAARDTHGLDGQLDSNRRSMKVIDDDVDDLDCEFLNNRQAFLNLCRGNHYQFDQLRRAKHTSMMVLWHLHNRK